MNQLKNRMRGKFNLNQEPNRNQLPRQILNLKIGCSPDMTKTAASTFTLSLAALKVPRLKPR